MINKCTAGGETVSWNHENASSGENSTQETKSGKQRNWKGGGEVEGGRGA